MSSSRHGSGGGGGVHGAGTRIHPQARLTRIAPTLHCHTRTNNTAINPEAKSDTSFTITRDTTVARKVRRGTAARAGVLPSGGNARYPSAYPSGARTCRSKEGGVSAVC